MNPAERITSCLSGKVPDRLPVMETVIDWKVMRALGYSDYYDMIDGLDLDAIFLNQLIYDPARIRWTDESKRLFKDPWGAFLKLTEETWPITIEGPIKARSDLDTYVPPKPEDDPILEVIGEVVARYKGERLIGMLARAVFVSTWNLLGMENLLVAYHTEPALVDEITRMVLDYNKEFHRLAIQAGLDLIMLGDDYAHKTATIMSPAHYRRFILPGFREVVQNIKDSGAYCVKHSDGNIWSIISDIADCGVDGVGPLEPGADMDLARVKELFPQLTVVGNVDVDLLARGSREDIHRTTLDLIRNVSPGGRHILSSGNSISASVKPENLREMIDTARAYGRY
jgi:uroporphyrinogen decarboxylase